MVGQLGAWLGAWLGRRGGWEGAGGWEGGAVGIVGGWEGGGDWEGGWEGGAVGSVVGKAVEMQLWGWVRDWRGVVRHWDVSPGKSSSPDTSESGAVLGSSNGRWGGDGLAPSCAQP